jgi:hypothetical protein
MDREPPIDDESAGQAADARDRQQYGARWSSLLDSANHRWARAEEELAQVRRLLDATRSRERALDGALTEFVDVVPALADLLPRNSAGRLFELRLAALVADARQAQRIGGGE